MELFKQLSILFLFMGAGYLLKRLDILPKGTAAVLSKLEIYLFIPATNLRFLMKDFNIPYLRGHYSMLLTSLVIVAVIIPLAKCIAFFLTKDRYGRAVYSYTLTAPNYGYTGYALMSAAYGAAMLLNMMIFIIPLSFYIYTEGYRILTCREKISLRHMLNPILVTMLLGCAIGLLELPIPDYATEILGKAAGCLAPISMILTGCVLASMRVLPLLKNFRIYIVTALRLVILPMLIVVVLCLFSLPSEVILVAAFTYCMPSGLNTVVFAESCNQKSDTAAGLIIVTNLLSLATIPFVMWATNLLI